MVSPTITKPTPTTRREMPDEKAATARLNAKSSTQNPRRIARTAYQVAGWSGERMKVPTAPPRRSRTRAPTRALRTRSRPRTRNGAPITGRRRCGAWRPRSGRPRGPRRRPAQRWPAPIQPGTRTLPRAMTPKTTSRTPRKRPPRPRSAVAAAIGCRARLPAGRRCPGRAAGRRPRKEPSTAGLVPAVGRIGARWRNGTGSTRPDRAPAGGDRLERDHEGHDDVEHDA